MRSSWEALALDEALDEALGSTEGAGGSSRESSSKDRLIWWKPAEGVAEPAREDAAAEEGAREEGAAEEGATKGAMGDALSRYSCERLRACCWALLLPEACRGGRACFGGFFRRCSRGSRTVDCLTLALLDD